MYMPTNTHTHTQTHTHPTLFCYCCDLMRWDGRWNLDDFMFDVQQQLPETLLWQYAGSFRIIGRIFLQLSIWKNLGDRKKKTIPYHQQVNKKAAVYLCLKDKYPDWGWKGGEEQGGGCPTFPFVLPGSNQSLSMNPSVWLLPTSCLVFTEQVLLNPAITHHFCMTLWFCWRG